MHVSFISNLGSNLNFEISEMVSAKVYCSLYYDWLDIFELDFEDAMLFSYA